MRRGFFVLFLFFSVAAGAQKINLPPVTRVTWENGVRVVLMEYRRAPTLTVTALFPGGEAAEPEDKVGVAGLTATLLRRGTETRTAPQIAEQIEFLGGTLSAGTSDDRFSAALSVLAKDADTGLDLFADVLRHPTFPTEELERERQLELAGLQSLADEPEAVADRVITETVFAGHPYGRFPTMTTLKAITQDDLRAYYHHIVTPNRMILVAVGDFKTDAMLAKLRARFGDWPRAEASVSAAPAVKPSPARIVLIDKPDATQTQVRFARVALPRNTPDYFAAQMANTILGGGFTSRLVDEIRVNRSLTYGIGSGFVMEQAGGDWKVSTFTKIETTRALLDATEQVLKRAAQGFTAEELRKSVGYRVGQFAIQAQSPQALAAQLADMTFYNLPNDYLQTYLTKLRAVPLSEVNRIAGAYFAPQGLALVLVAPAAKVQPQLKGLPNVETRPVTGVGK